MSTEYRCRWCKDTGKTALAYTIVDCLECPVKETPKFRIPDCDLSYLDAYRNGNWPTFEHMTVNMGWDELERHMFADMGDRYDPGIRERVTETTSYYDLLDYLKTEISHYRCRVDEGTVKDWRKTLQSA